ncbi:MAG: WecB/TagA/CpsF family glycosyltransferase [Anaerolineae bacterium]|nr:WecB/TagA/CpsF family glycosyltransferase [Anaerolineae bacterium]
MDEHDPSRADAFGKRAIISKGVILGVNVHAVTMELTLSVLEEWIRDRKPHYVCCVPAHSVMECVDHPELQAVFNNSGLSTPDGMAIVWLLRAQGFSRVERVYGPDLLRAACRAGQALGWRHYFYGASPETCEKLVLRLKADFPDLIIAGVESPPYRDLNEDEKIAFIERVRQSRPDILWVALGSPKQERWMSGWVNILDVPVMIGVGAAFDFLAGRKPQALPWIQRMGLEWFFRLLIEPGRLWKRYLLNYPRFVFLVFLSALGFKKG